jgi:hypothetical protein
MSLSHLLAPRAVEQGIKEEFYKLRTCTCGASNLRPNSLERNIYANFSELASSRPYCPSLDRSALQAATAA